MLSTGIEGDPLGVLEVPLVFKWFPQDRGPGWGWSILDYRFFFGAALQVFNTASPIEHGLDVRPFIRIGAGLRFYVIQAEIFYEVAPPVGDWNGPRGLVEHKLGFSFPFAF